MTSEDRDYEIKDYLRYLDTLYDALALGEHPATIVALGFSQGTATVSRWVYRNQRRVDALICYAGEIGKELQNPAAVDELRHSDNYFVYGTQDKFITPAHIAAGKALLINFEWVSFEGKHEINASVLAGLW
jgi:predicted esterase